jgi:phenylpyruvate tautomerase PptA (4-oxalocrotonate tautomerase family)
MVSAGVLTEGRLCIKLRKSRCNPSKERKGEIKESNNPITYGTSSRTEPHTNLSRAVPQALPFIATSTSNGTLLTHSCFSTTNQVQHTYPLSAEQQQAIAQQITDLHSTTFLVPSLFVNVVFQHLQPTTTTYFLAGKPTTHNSAGPNRILGMVRQGPNRTKADFDRLAQRIEDAWYDVVNSPDKAGTESKEDRKAKKLHLVVMYPMIAARENGTTIPGVCFSIPLQLPPSRSSSGFALCNISLLLALEKASSSPMKFFNGVPFCTNQ